MTEPMSKADTRVLIHHATLAEGVKPSTQPGLLVNRAVWERAHTFKDRASNQPLSPWSEDARVSGTVRANVRSLGKDYILPEVESRQSFLQARDRELSRQRSLAAKLAHYTPPEIIPGSGGALKDNKPFVVSAATQSFA